MSTSNEKAMRLALEALKDAYSPDPHPAIKALEIALSEREALAQSRSDVKQSDSVEQRSVSEQLGEPHSWYSAQEDEWMTDKTRKDHERLNSYTHKVGGFDLPLYTTPYVPTGRQQRTAERKPLTDEQIAEAVGWVAGRGCKPLPIELQIARAIEAAHGIKENT